MKKLLILFLSSFFLMTTSCSTEEIDAKPVTENLELPQVPIETNFTEENPLQTFLSMTRYNEYQTLCTNQSVFKEVGFKFKTLEKGTMNAIAIKIPITNNSLLVTIKDDDSNQTLRTETINVTTADTEITKTIVPVKLGKNKIYTITMKSKIHYKRFRSDYSQPQYPVNAGNIKIITPVSNEFSSDGITMGGTGNFYSGDCSFTFLRTE